MSRKIVFNIFWNGHWFESLIIRKILKYYQSESDRGGVAFSKQTNRKWSIVDLKSSAIPKLDETFSKWYINLTRKDFVMKWGVDPRHWDTHTGFLAHFYPSTFARGNQISLKVIYWVFRGQKGCLSLTASNKILFIIPVHWTHVSFLIQIQSQEERKQDEIIMIRYIILIIFIITLISLLSLFEKPAVHQYYQIQNREVAVEKVEELIDIKKTPEMIYSQRDMDFLMDAYGVGGP